MEMDFKSMKRKELQALCKKHGLPANSTNAQMAESIASLLLSQEKTKPRGCLKGSAGSSGEDVVRARGPAKKVSFILEEERFHVDDFDENPDGRKRRTSRRRSVVASSEEMETNARFESPGREHDVPVRTRRSRSLAEAVLWSPVVEKKKATKGMEGVRQNVDLALDVKLASEDEGDKKNLGNKDSSEMPATRSLRNRVVVVGEDEGLLEDVEPRETRKRRRSSKGMEGNGGMKVILSSEDEGDVGKAVKKTSSDVPVTRSLRGRVVVVGEDEGMLEAPEPGRTRKRQRSVKGAEEKDTLLTEKLGENEAAEKKDMYKLPEGMVSDGEVLFIKGSQKVPPLKEAPPRRSGRNLSKINDLLPANEKQGTDEASFLTGGNLGDDAATVARKKSSKKRGNHTSKHGDHVAFSGNAGLIESAPSKTQKAKLSDPEEPPRRSKRSSRHNVLGDAISLPACDSSANVASVIEKNKPGKQTRKMQSVVEVKDSGPETVAATAPAETHKETISDLGEPSRRSTHSSVQKAVKKNNPGKQATKLISGGETTENSTRESEFEVETHKGKISELVEHPRRSTHSSVHNTSEDEGNDVKAIKNRRGKQARKQQSARDGAENSSPKSEPATTSEEFKIQEDPKWVVEPESAPKRAMHNTLDHGVSLLVNGKLGDGDETVSENKLQKLSRELGLKKQGATPARELNRRIGNRKRKLGGRQRMEDETHLTLKCPIVTSDSVEIGDPANSNTHAGPATEVFAANLSIVVETGKAEVGHSNDFVEKDVSEELQSIPFDNIVSGPIHNCMLKESGNGISLEESPKDGLKVSLASQSCEKHSNYLEIAHEARVVPISKVVEGSSEIASLMCSNVQVDLGAEGAVDAAVDVYLYVDNKTAIQCPNGLRLAYRHTLPQVMDAEATGFTMVTDINRTPIDTTYSDNCNGDHEATDILCLPLSSSRTKALSLSNITEASSETDHEYPLEPADTHDALEIASHVNSCSSIQTSCYKEKSIGHFTKVADSSSGGSSTVKRVFRNEMGICGTSMASMSNAISSEEGDVAKESVPGEVKIMFAPKNFSSEQKFGAETGECNADEVEIEGEVSQSHLYDNLASEVWSDDQVAYNGAGISAKNILNGSLLVASSSSYDYVDGSDFVETPVDNRGTSSPMFASEIVETISQAAEVSDTEDPLEDSKVNTPSCFDCIESEEHPKVTEVEVNNIEFSFPKSLDVFSDIKVVSPKSPGSLKVSSVVEVEGKFGASSQANLYKDNEDASLPCSVGNKTDRHVEGQEISNEVVDAESYKSTTACDESFIDALPYKDNKGDEATSVTGFSFSCCHAGDLSALTGVEAFSQIGNKEPANLPEAHVVNEVGSHDNAPSPICTVENQVETVKLLALGAKVVTEDSIDLQHDTDYEVGLSGRLATGGHDVVSGVKENHAHDCDSRSCEIFSVEPGETFISSSILVDTVHDGARTGRMNNEEEITNSEIRQSLELENSASDICLDDQERDHAIEASSEEIVNGSMDMCTENHSNVTDMTNEVKSVELLAMDANTVNQDSINLENGCPVDVGANQMAPCSLSIDQSATEGDDIVHGVKENFEEGYCSPSCEAFSDELKEKFTSAYLLVDTAEVGLGTGSGKNVQESITAETRQSLMPVNLLSDLCLVEEEQDHRNVLLSEDTAKCCLVATFSNQTHPNLTGMAVTEGGSFSSNFKTITEGHDYMNANILCGEGDSSTASGKFYEDNRDTYPVSCNKEEDLATVQESRCSETNVEIPAPTIAVSELRTEISIVCEGFNRENFFLCDTAKSSPSEEFSNISRIETTPPDNTERPATPLETPDTREMAPSNNDSSPVILGDSLDDKSEGLLTDVPGDSNNMERISTELSVDTSSSHLKIESCMTPYKLKETFVEVHNPKSCCEVGSPLCKPFSETSDSYLCEVGFGKLEKVDAYGLIDKDHKVSSVGSSFSLNIFEENNVSDAVNTGSGFLTKAAYSAVQIFERSRELLDGDTVDKENIDASKGESNFKFGGGTFRESLSNIYQDEFDRENVGNLETPSISKGFCYVDGESDIAAITADPSLKNTHYQGSAPIQDHIMPLENFASSGKHENGSSDLQSDSNNEAGAGQVVPGNMLSAQLASGEYTNIVGVKEIVTEGCSSQSCEAFSAEVKEKIKSSSLSFDTAEFDAGDDKAKYEEEKIMDEATKVLVSEKLTSDLCSDGKEQEHISGISSEDTLTDAANIAVMEVEGGEPFSSNMTVSEEQARLDSDAVFKEGLSSAAFLNHFCEANKDSPHSPVVSDTAEELAKVQEDKFLVSDAELSAVTHIIPETREDIRVVCDDIYEENINLCDAVNNISTKETSWVRNTERTIRDSNERPATPVEIPSDKEMTFDKTDCSDTKGCLHGKAEGVLSDWSVDSKIAVRTSGIVSVNIFCPQQEVEECKETDKLIGAYPEFHSSQSCGFPLCNSFSDPSCSQLCEVDLNHLKDTEVHGLSGEDHEISSDESLFDLTIFEDNNELNDAGFACSDHRQNAILESLSETTVATSEILDVVVERDLLLGEKSANDIVNIGASENVSSSEKPENGPSKRNIILPDAEHLPRTNADATCEDVFTDCQEFSSPQKEDYLRALGIRHVTESGACEGRILTWECLVSSEKSHTEQGDLFCKFSNHVDREEICNSSMGRFDQSLREDPEVAEKEIENYGLGEYNAKDTYASLPIVSDRPFDAGKLEVRVAKEVTVEMGPLCSSGEHVCETCIESSEAEDNDQDASGELNCKTCTFMEGEPCIGGEVAGQVSFNSPLSTAGDYLPNSPSKSGIDPHVEVSECQEFKGGSGSDQMEIIGSRLIDFRSKSGLNTPMRLVERFDPHTVSRLKDKENTPNIKMDGPMKRNIEKSVNTGSVRRPLHPVPKQ